MKKSLRVVTQCMRTQVAASICWINRSPLPITRRLLLVALMAWASQGFSQTNPDLQTFFKQYIELTDEQIKDIRSGKAVAKVLPSRTPDEIIVFGAVYVHARPEAYVKFARDFERLRKTSGYLAIGPFSSPPQISDLKGFAFDSDDVKSLKDCKPGDCQIQMPTSSIENLQQSIDWSAPNPAAQVNRLLREKVLERLSAYQKEGNKVLDVYNDKEHPVDVAKQFKYMLSYARALPKYLPEFYGYLLTYPQGKPANTEDSFYWANVKFGLKPTLRVVHMVTMRGSTGNDTFYVIAEKQLYSSHYFQTALDLTFCLSEASNTGQPGFYLIREMGSEQSGLTGFKGSIVRKSAVGRSSSALRDSLTAIKKALESSP
jgi:hypothetical protein